MNVVALGRIVTSNDETRQAGVPFFLKHHANCAFSWPCASSLVHVGPSL